MKRFKRNILATVLVATIGLSGCDAINEGYEVGMATVEFVQTQESIFSTVASIEQQVSQAQGLNEIIAVHQQVIDQLQEQKQSIVAGDNSQMLQQMSSFLVDDVVMMLENNIMMMSHLAPMHLSIGERYNAASTEQSYQQHKEKLLALQQTATELATHIDGDMQSMSSVIAQSDLPQELQLLLNEAIKAFNSEYKIAILNEMSSIPDVVAQELKWFDYIFEHKNVISVNENNELIFATQTALDQYNAVFGE